MHTSSNGVRVPFRQVEPIADESFGMTVIQQADSGCSWHFHPEHQIGYVIQGRGERIVGDSVRPIREGELVLLGANVPHVWRFDKTQSPESTRAIVIHFRNDFLGSEFFAKPEMRDVRLLLSRASLGLQASGKTRTDGAAIVESMLNHDGMERVLELLSLLHLLAGSNELNSLCSSGFQPLSAELEVERLRRVCDYVQSNLSGSVDRDSAAKVAHLSPSAFSRFFKTHTGKTFQEFVNEVRIGHACRLLMEQQISVTNVAAHCGFSDVSSFNRSFRRIRNASPTEFRQRVAGITEGR